MSNACCKLLCSIVVAFLCAGVATAQDTTISGPLAAHPDNPVVLPPPPVYTNCGVGCTHWGNKAYYISGTAATEAPGQTIAVEFTWKGTQKLTKVIEANLMFSGAGPIGAAILRDENGKPGAVLTTLKTKASCPGTANQPCTYKPPKPVAVKAGTKLWLCQYALKTADEGGWDESVKDQSNAGNFYYNREGTCSTSPSNWLDQGSDYLRPAFEID